METKMIAMLAVTMATMDDGDGGIDIVRVAFDIGT